MKIKLSFFFALVFANIVFGQYDTEFQSIIDLFDQEQNTPGITASINLNGEGEWQGASGISHGDVAMDTSMYVGIASNTKLFTSILTLKMIENGFYSLDDPISMWIDSIRFVDPSITIRQLLRHNSGANDFINNSELFPGLIVSDPTRVWTPEETLAYIFEPIAEPGEGIYYSNTNYILAGMVMESATGLLYEDILRDSLLTPLNLTDIFIEGFDEIPGTLAHPFLLGTDFIDTERIALGTSTWAAGALVTKPKSLTDWYDIVFRTEYFSEFIIDNITEFVEWPDDLEGKEMGMGLYRLNINDRTYYGHGGGTIGYSSYTLYDTECGHTFSVVINELFSRPLDLAVLLAEKACELTNMESDVEEVLAGINIDLYPNPTSQVLRIPGAKRIVLFGRGGSMLRSVNGEQMDISAFPSGLYFVKGLFSNGPFVSKLVIQ